MRGDVPSFLDFLRDMSYIQPPIEMELPNYPPISRNFWRMFIDIVQTGQLLVATHTWDI